MALKHQPRIIQGFKNICIMKLFTLAMLPLILNACFMPEHMEVRSGIDPRNQDDDVRFRTIYYFRVFDACQLKENASHSVDSLSLFRSPPKPPSGKIIRDSLYRFRMTGKASSLFSHVHFESGTLHKAEIDPFGSNIQYDEDSKRYYLKTRNDTGDSEAKDSEAKEKIRWNDKIDSLRELNQKLEKENLSNDEIKESIKKEINKILSKDEDSLSEDKDSTNKQGCPAGKEARRGFQILGPEGLRTFNQGERLVMAMTSSDRPLLSALRELSGRMQQEQKSHAEQMLPLVQENLKALHTIQSIENISSQTSTKSQLKTAKDQFKTALDKFDPKITAEETSKKSGGKQ